MATKEEITSAIEDRTQFYLMLSKLFSWPLSQEELDSIEVDSLKQLSESTDNELMAEGFNDMYRFLRRKSTGTRQRLNADFTGCFLGRTTYEGLSAQPYASLYLSPEGQLMGKARMAVNQEYRQHRVKLDQGIDIPEDHLSFECEFMAIIGHRAVQALDQRDVDGVVKQLEIQQTFLKHYIMNWFGRFYSLSNKIARTRFYGGVLKAAKGFLESESSTIETLVAEARSVA